MRCLLVDEPPRRRTRSALLLVLALAVLPSCTPSGISAACDEDADCESGECYTESNPGYCTALCETEGSTDECPADTVCKRIVGDEPRCILLCEDDGDCPDNADCNSVTGDLSGCEPVR